MAHEEAAFSRQHSAVSENQHQNQKRFTTEDTEATEEGTEDFRGLELRALGFDIFFIVVQRTLDKIR